jgi:probable H4MPT-linked C1 transfer pathway protein
MAVIGWDIGGVNTKVARVEGGVVRAVLSEPFEIQRDPPSLARLLATLAQRVGASPNDRHAVTMTAELSQIFRTKRDGVSFVLDAVTSAFAGGDISVYTVDGRFLSVGLATAEPLAVAASNWAATASVVALEHPSSILIDTGTTTTDIIPIVDGVVAAAGATDPERLASGELVYTGALRTPVEAIVHHVPLGDATAGVSAESFALAGDIYVWRGDLSPEDYSVATPDGRPATREFARERIARIVCADRELLDDFATSRIADAVAAAQVEQIARGIRHVRARHPSLTTAVVTGLGAFIAHRAVAATGLMSIALADSLGVAAARSAPAAAVALLLDRADGATKSVTRVVPNVREGVADVVVKIGGGLLAHPKHLQSVADAVVRAARHTRLTVVPGGGPFADTVRAVDAGVPLGDDAAHWMAILAMDQYAHLLASLHSGFVLVNAVPQIVDTLAAGRVPIIAPFQWLRAADPLPHAWSVTSDSISAWIANQLGAERLLLVKPPRAIGDALVDPHFSTVRPPHISWITVPGDSIDDLRNALELADRR